MQKLLNKSIILSLLIFFSLPTYAYYGTDNRRARMWFEGKIEVLIPEDLQEELQDLSAEQAAKSIKNKISEELEYQLKHMVGAFTEHPGFINSPGSLLFEYKYGQRTKDAYLKIKKHKWKTNEVGETLTVTYDFSDIVVFLKKRIAIRPKDKEQPTQKLRFYLPKEMTQIYNKGLVGEVNYCTDVHYNTEDDFFYFWNPYLEDCPLDKRTDLFKVKAHFKALNSSATTTPHWEELLGDNGNGKEFLIHYIVGADESFKKKDLGRKTYNEALLLLQEKLGFKIDKLATKKARKTKDGSKFFTKLRLNANGVRYVINMDLANPENKFRRFLQSSQYGLENADLFIYDGHSGLGGFLDPELFSTELETPLELNPKKHQVFFFNGCSTLTYYNHIYFLQKKTPLDPKGRQNLDIITNAVGASFDIGAASDVSIIESFINPKDNKGAYKSWPQIIDELTTFSIGDSALAQVNGDEH